MKVTEFAFEAMLVRWAETSNGGATVVLQLADVDDLEVFKMLTLKSAKHAGQRLAIGCAVIGDDEKPVPVEVKDRAPQVAAADPAAQAADRKRVVDNAILDKHQSPSFDAGAAADARIKAACADKHISHPAKTKPHFPAGKTGLAVMWCGDEDFRFWLYAHAPAVVEPENGDYDEKWAKAVICAACGIVSRKELDSNHDAARLFDEKIRAPYQAYLAEQKT